MNWIKVEDQKPPAYIDILVTDREKCWIAQTFDNLEIFLASHPDHNREPKNEFGCPYITHSKPTHWMPLPEKPE